MGKVTVVLEKLTNLKDGTCCAAGDGFGSAGWVVRREECIHHRGLSLVLTLDCGTYIFSTHTHTLTKTGDGLGKSDPYVKLELFEDGLGFDKSFGEQESSHKDNTIAPEYHETFTWTVPASDIGGLLLTCTVMDGDIGLDDKVGKCTIRLADIEKDLSHFCAVEKKLDNKWFSKDATIHVKVKFEK
jgi:Ca2+-dependent lipid-binding protein